MKKTINFCPYCGSKLEDAEAYGRIRRVCPKCNYIHFHDPKVAVVTFLEHQGKVLLVKRGVEPELGKWALPAGYVDYGEDPRQTAIRETCEETGLNIKTTELLDVMFYHQQNAVIVIIYAAHLTGGTLQAADDAVDAGWFAPDELPDIAFESTRIILNRWIKKQTPPE